MLRRAEASPSEVTRRLAAKVRVLLAQLGERLAVEDKRAEVVRLRAELGAAKTAVRAPQKPMTPEIQAECVRLYVEKELTVGQVAVRVDRPWSSVRRALVGAGVQMRTQRWSKPRAGSGL